MNFNQYCDIKNNLIDLDPFNKSYPAVNLVNIYDGPIQTKTEFEGRHENNIEKLLSVTPKDYKTYVFIDNLENDVNACSHEDNSSLIECDNEIYPQDKIQYILNESADIKVAKMPHTTSADGSSETVPGKSPDFEVRDSTRSNTELEAQIISLHNDKATLNYQSNEIPGENDIMGLSSSLNRFVAYNVFDTDIKFEDEMLIRTTEAQYLQNLQDSTNGNQDTQFTDDNYTKLLLKDKQIDSNKIISDSLENKLKQGDHLKKSTWNARSSVDSEIIHKTLESQQNSEIGKNEYEKSFVNMNSKLAPKTVPVDTEKLKRTLNEKFNICLKKSNLLNKNDTCDSELLNLTQQKVVNAEKTHSPKNFNKNTKSEIYYVCDYCNKRFRSKDGLKVHIIAKELSRNSAEHYQCQLCKKTFYKKRRLYDHVVNLHEDSENQCEICQKKFKCKKYLRQHIARVHFKKNKANVNSSELFKFHCEFCPKTFKAKDNLNHHINNIHKAGACICYICGSVLKCEPYLLNHLRRVHYDDGKSHQCECGKVFRSPRYLNIHKKNMNHFNKPITVRRPSGKYIDKSLIASKACVLTNDCLSISKIDETTNNVLKHNNNFSKKIMNKNHKPLLSEWTNENDIPTQRKPSIARKDEGNSINLVFSDESQSRAETDPKSLISSVSANKSKYIVFITKGHKKNTTEKAVEHNDNTSQNTTAFASTISGSYCNKDSSSTSEKNVNEWSVHFENSVKKTKKILRRLKKSAKKPCSNTSIDWCIDTENMLL